MTDGGDWMWQSDYTWGYIPFHYGRWVWAGSYWGWIPGRRYAPAWVTWRVGEGGYIGWAPLPPAWYWSGGMAVGLWSVPYAAYCFVPTRYAFYGNVSSYVVRDRGMVQSHRGGHAPLPPGDALGGPRRAGRRARLPHVPVARRRAHPGLGRAAEIRVRMTRGRRPSPPAAPRPPPGRRSVTTASGCAPAPSRRRARTHGRGATRAGTGGRPPRCARRSRALSAPRGYPAYHSSAPSYYGGQRSYGGGQRSYGGGQRSLRRGPALLRRRPALRAPGRPPQLPRALVRLARVRSPLRGPGRAPSLARCPRGRAAEPEGPRPRLQITSFEGAV